MSCENCSQAQEMAHVVRAGGAQTFVRVGAANMELVGCTTHELELINVLRGWHEIEGLLPLRASAGADFVLSRIEEIFRGER